jgi:Copper type II ascorbate-dependent monooxygenase, C-terminal domain
VGGAAGEIVVGPGDRLTTTCTYENDTSRIITFGQGTAQEMCYNFVVAWPAGSLNTGGNLLDGPNRCMQ